MKKILVTGAAGFIGSVLCKQLAANYEVVGLDTRVPADSALGIAWEQIDISDQKSVTALCKKYSPEVLIHCAGIAHQKLGAMDLAAYLRVNSEATENLARAAGELNPGVRFIFLSSVSVYGEEGLKMPVSEDALCRPSGDYAVSKLDAERRLMALSDKGIIRDLVILRLAPVYDRTWSFNLDRRVLAPLKAAYIRFGQGTQRMSALARPNLVDFIIQMIKSGDENARDGSFSATKQQRKLRIFNVSDAKPYDFNAIIRIFKKSGIRQNKPVISVPLSFVWLATRIAGVILANKKKWVHACYDKLASDLVFDNNRMIKAGFEPKHSLETIFLT